MSRIIEEEVDAPIRTRTSKAYRDNYDTIDWGDDDEIQTTRYCCNLCSDTGCVVDPALVDSAETEGDMLTACPECARHAPECASRCTLDAKCDCGADE